MMQGGMGNIAKKTQASIEVWDSFARKRNLKMVKNKIQRTICLWGQNGDAENILIRNFYHNNQRQYFIRLARVPSAHDPIPVVWEQQGEYEFWGVTPGVMTHAFRGNVTPRLGPP